jgi:VCBS repeat-containing protein
VVGGEDTLEGGEGADFLYGGESNDTLYGANGETVDDNTPDFLYGGTGHDNYYAGTGDWVEDEDGKGTIYYCGYNIADMEYEQLYEGAYKVRYPDGTDTGIVITYDKETKELVGNVGFVSIDNFENGDFGLTLPETEVSVPPEANITLIGTNNYNSTQLLGAGEDRHYVFNSGNITADVPIVDFGNGSMGVAYPPAAVPDISMDLGGGNDEVFGLAGNDYMLGGEGDDRIWGDIYWYGWYDPEDYPFSEEVERNQRNILLGQGGNDHVLGSRGTDFIAGGDDGDVLDGDEGNDTLGGDDGNDALFGGEGDDNLFGGSGDDLLHGDSFLLAPHPGRSYDPNPIQFSFTFSEEKGYPVSVTLSGQDRFFRSDSEPGKDLLVGGDGRDVLYGEMGDDQLLGEDGEDCLIGGSGNDELYGGNQNDFLDGDDGGSIEEAAGGNDKLYGGSGNDDLGGRGGDDFLDGGQDDDSLWGHVGNDILLGGTGNDDLFGGDGNDTLQGEIGNDYLNGGSGDDLLIGGTGEDIYYFEPGFGEDRVICTSEGGTGDRIAFGSGINPWQVKAKRSPTNTGDLVLTVGDDVLTIANYFPDVTARPLIQFEEDHSAIWNHTRMEAAVKAGETGLAPLFGTTDNDELVGGDSGELLDGGQGEDTLQGNGGDDALFGGAGGDNLQGGDGNDRLYGGSGDDTLTSGSGNDLLVGGSGSNTYVFEPTPDGFGEDRIVSISGNDRIEFYGTLRPEFVTARRSKEAPDDLVLRIDGGGILTVVNYFADATARPLIWFEQGQQYGGQVLPVVWEYAQISTAVLQGGPGDDFLLGDNGNDLLTGGDGNDELYGGEGSDRLFGENGDDVLTGGVDNDYLCGGVGNDRYCFARGFGQDTVSDSCGDADDVDVIEFVDIWPVEMCARRQASDLILETEGGDCLTVADYFDREPSTETEIHFRDGTIWTIEQFKGLPIDGTDGDDVLKGFEGDEQLTGVGGDDQLFGMEGKDFLSGGPGQDTLEGGLGDDLLFGGTGNDTIAGGYGADVLRGGPGDDSYIYNRWDGSDTILDAYGNDTILFGAGIRPSDLIGMWDNANKQLVLGIIDEVEKLKAESEGLPYAPDPSNLKQKIVIQGWANPDNQIETFRFSDGATWSSQHLLDTLGVVFNDPPVVSGPVILNDMLEDGSCVIAAEDLLANASDGDGDPLAVEDLLVSTGTLEALEQGRWRYLPDADYHGLVEFSYQVTDGTDGVSAAAGLTVMSVNDTPVAPENEIHEVLGELTIEGTLGAHDVDGDTLTFNLPTGPQHGTLTIGDNGHWVYNAEEGYCGNDQAIVTVEDGQGGTAQTVLDFTINVFSGGNVVVDRNAPSGLRLEGIRRQDLTFVGQGDDLRIEISNSGSLLLKEFFADAQNNLEWLETSDGKLNLATDTIVNAGTSGIDFFGTWCWGDNNLNDLLRGSQSADRLFGFGQNDVLFGFAGNDLLSGSHGSDTLVGGDGDDRLIGGRGDDHLFGGQGNDGLSGNRGDDFLGGGTGDDDLNGGDGRDELYGGIGDDDLFGGSENDLLAGGQGDDHLRGGAGDDIYIFNQGDGHDLLRDDMQGGWGWLWQGDGGHDTARFGNGIDIEDISLYMRRGTLQIQYGDDDILEIRQQNHPKRGIERIELEDGSYLTDADVNQLIQQMAAFAVDEGIAMNSLDDVRKNQELMTMVANAWHTT